MFPDFAPARDHLMRAAGALDGADMHSRQIRHIIERTVRLMEELQEQRRDNVLDLDAIRRQRAAAGVEG